MSETHLPTIALTSGEPAGIGPDLCVLLAQKSLPARVVVIGDREMLQARAEMLGLPFKSNEFVPGKPDPGGAGALSVRHQPLAERTIPGKLNPANSRYVIKTLESAAQGCLDGDFDAMVTTPAHKGVINDAGIAFTGHTEFLAGKTGVTHPVMLLVGGGMRVALATTHLPLKDVAAAITREGLERTLRVLYHDLIARFGIARPRILVAGLNPHSGESGYLGREEIEIIVPTLEKLRAEGLDLWGPLPADTLFNQERLRAADCVLAMYHDQGLPVLKYASFGKAVNITLGLPIIRTSVDHGTALELAGTSKIDSGSLMAAVDMALELVKNNK